MKEKRNKPVRQGMVQEHTPLSITADVIIIAVLALVIFCCVIPMWHVLMSSLSDGRTLLSKSGLVLLPEGGVNWGGYEYLFSHMGSFASGNILRGYCNTILYVVGNVCFGTVLNVLGGYVLSQQTKLRSPMTLVILISFMFSGGTVPTYMVLRNLGLTGTAWSLILPSCTNAMFIVMMSNAFRGVPWATVESARIDGAGHLRTMFQIMLPQCMGYVLVTMINTGILAWNSWFEASIYVSNIKELWPLQLWIKDIVASNEDFLNSANPDYNRYLIQYSVIIVSSLPILCLFPTLQKYLQKGSLAGAVKG